MKRVEQVKKLNEIDSCDVLVIGGGATGLGTAIDAASRGYSTVLLEANDFAKGTSSRSTKLVHGGVRYLAQGYVDLVKEALRERGLLAQNASHLVKNQSFIIPNYRFVDKFMYKIGLSVYEKYAGKLSLGKTKSISKRKTLQKLPNLVSEKLKNGVVYQDGQFDDSRLAINMAQTAIEQGACVVNYAKVSGLLKDDKDNVVGVEITDKISHKIYKLSCKVVINATGVFTNEIMQMDKKTDRDFVVPSQGIHLVLDKEFLQSDDAIMIPKTSDGRVLFAVPWHDKVVVGTTDVLVEKAELEPKPLQDEVDFILKTASLYLKKKPTRKDVKSVFAGLRPLAAPEKEGKSTKEVSRSHKVIVSETGLITITGGKWTTYRQMAEDAVNKAIKLKKIEKKPCQTQHLSLHGNMPKEQVDRTNHLYIYGSDIPRIEKLKSENPEYAEKIHENYAYTIAEVIWAIREEMALNLEDVLARRVRLLFLDAQAAIDCAPKVAKAMAKELNHDKQWIEKQVDSFTKLAKTYLLV
ncbi:MAG: FAD-dependent oxidoreductase [Bacteroidia bacterium]|nr:MAG: FAD-dependent oxidoreductase [Bacteroidia bacterium]